ncbi:MAG: pyridoxal phosphate-dependent aminotransferase [Oscillospiraceae bacterium]|nr:pyridoxal phosphate-dependent aminotransferase [Oscillospiraceae bacterium]
MVYDFDTPVNRRGTDSVKWDVAENELPMWVADMDFQAAPEIREAFRIRLEHGVFGYADLTDDWYNAYIGWWKNRHNFLMERDWLIFCTGVIPAISSVVRKLTTPNENVVVQSPVYNIFYNSIINNGCRVLESRLIYENGEYSVDFEDLEKKLSDPQTTLMIFCNPHNPVGKIWDRYTLEKIGNLAKKYNVKVISDEIHCDLTSPGKEYIPFASVSETNREVSITCIAPTKAFNLAGLQTAAVCVPDPFLRHKVWRALNTDEVAEPNSFASTAAIAAFGKGGAWLDELREYIAENKRISAEYIKENIPGVFVVKGDATYLLWIDISALSGDSSEVAAFVRKHTGLYVSAGSHYGKGGEHFLRMNVACGKSVCLDGLNRLKEGINLYRKEKTNKSF